MGRAPCCDKANVKRGPWSPEEDAKLKSYIEKHGTGGNWIALPQKIGLKRCGKSCRLRWLNYLRPNIKHGGFTEEEDNLICSLYISIGSRWSIIAAQLPGRTDNDIKNYWNTRLKKKLLGKQRRDQQARRGSCSTKQVEQTKKEWDETYSINECFSLYPQQATSSFVDTLIMPTYEAKLANYVDHSQPNFETLRYIASDASCSQNQELVLRNDPMITPAPSTRTAFTNDLCLPLPNDFQAFGEITDEIIYGMSQNLELDLINSNTMSIVSPENTNLGNISSLLYPSALPNYEACQSKITQDWSYLDEPRLLGYSM